VKLKYIATSVMLLFIALLPAALVYGQPEMEGHYYQINDVPALSQYPELPNGCEATATTMLLNWAGLDINKTDVANAIPSGPMPSEMEDGSYVGANPEDEFVGDAFSIGYGVFHKPIARLINQLLPDRALDLTGHTFDELLNSVQNGYPVIVWATEQMEVPYEKEAWVDAAGNDVIWNEPEHALLLTGWDDDHAYMNDPITGEKETYNLWGFKTVWEAMGSQAVTLHS
jgi:uncharacterized protein YvpB